jgi:2',3'-cyclic-nucleotide 2'-phosphodiesterase/3'-nucleotidase
VLDAQTQAAKVGRAKIHLVLNEETNRYEKQIETELIDMTQYEPDDDFSKTFQYAVNEVNEFVDAPIGYLSKTIYGEPSLFGPSEFMDLIHNAQLDATGADVSFAAVLAAHDSVAAGPVTMRQLFTLYRYENSLVTVNMTGEEVERYLNYGISKQYNGMKNENDHLLAFLFDENGEIAYNVYGPRFLTPTFNFTSAAGIKYQINLDKPQGKQLTIISMSDGSKFDKTKTYKVALNSYQANGGGNFVPEGLGWSKQEFEKHVIAWSDQDVRHYIADYLHKHDTIVPKLRGDWSVVLDKWFKKGVETDMKFINPNQR